MAITRGLIEIETFCGVKVYVTPLAPHTRQRILDIVMEQYPDFDDTPFREKLEGTLDANATYLNDKHPEYIRLRNDLDNKRVQLRNRLFFEMSCEFQESEAELLAKFKKQIEKFKKISPDESEWEIVLHQIILARDTERGLILNAVIDRLELTPGEVQDGMKIFRPQIP